MGLAPQQPQAQADPAVVREPSGFEVAACEALLHAMGTRGRVGSVLDLLVQRAFGRMTWVPAWMSWTQPHARGVALLLLAGTRGRIPAEIVPVRLHGSNEDLANQALTTACVKGWCP